MEGPGLALHDLDKTLRKDVLAGVLLHMVKAAGPVNLAMNLLAFVQLPVQEMDNLFSILKYMDHAGGAQRPPVRRLPAGLGIEAGAVEDNSGTAFVNKPLQDAGIKLFPVSILEIKPLSHPLPLLIEAREPVEWS